MYLKLLIVGVFALIFTVGFSQQKKGRKYPIVKFRDIGGSKADTLQFTAIVKSTYKCPPCPEGAQCKPCIGDHVEVTDGNTKNSLRIFTHEPDRLKVGETCIFLVRFRSALHRDDNIELVRILK